MATKKSNKTKDSEPKKRTCPNCKGTDFVEIVKDAQFKCTNCGYVLTVK